MVALTDARLREAMDQAAWIERAVRFHLATVGPDAMEQVRGQVAYRHAVALRRALDNWAETRTLRAVGVEQHG
jgi:hypothetical protein